MIRTTGSLRVLLSRHAEAGKNLVNVHGGGDQRLTPTGERQARTLGGFMLGLLTDGESLRVVHQPEGRSEATARHIGIVAASGD